MSQKDIKNNPDHSSRGLMWKLLRTHISKSQLIGFSLASLVGLTIVILAVQFFQDVKPLFKDEDSFLRKDYMIITRKVSTASTVLQSSNEFEAKDIKDIEQQPWCRQVGKFSSNDYSVEASILVNGQGMRTMMFFESLPDEFLDVTDRHWKFDPNNPKIPVIISRDYLTLYNFGFAPSQGLPQASELAVSKAVKLQFTLRGNGNVQSFEGIIIGFSSRLNTIVVPEDFMKWSNEQFGSGIERNPSRLIVEVNSPGDERIASYFKDHGYQVAGDKMQQSKAQGFLNIIVSIVILVGIIISVLAFFILMLSIYLLLQKNTKKLQDLLVLGYSPNQVSRTYINMVIYINCAVMVVSIILMLLMRAYYMPMLKAMDVSGGKIYLSLIVAVIIMSLISFGNIMAIKRKINDLWIQSS
ncbi:MAG: ABC transporter permease [Muribaculaceae bacterium]|nr:ABC transporter permease [Muribaculaceae bacterium]